MVAVKINTGVGLCSCKSQPPLFQEELLMIKATSSTGSFDGPLTVLLSLFAQMTCESLRGDGAACAFLDLVRSG